MAAPTNVQYDFNTGILSWDAVPGVTEYEVGISEVDSAPWQDAGTTTTTSFSLLDAPFNSGYAVVRNKREQPDDPWSKPPTKWGKPVR